MNRHPELDSEIISDPHLKGVLAIQKVNHLLENEDAQWQDFVQLDKVTTPTDLNKNFTKDAADEIQANQLNEAFGFTDVTLKRQLPSIDLSKRASLDLDSLEKRAKSPHETLAVRLWKISKTTGTPSEEMQAFFQRYQHLCTAEIKAAVQSAIKAFDIPLFIRLMGEVVTLQFAS